MSDNYLNLARKWRSKHFDEIVGQELAVRIIKNGLFRNLIFPVYLLSGQRGCGKTSTARIFASALNCHKLEIFQKEPKSVQLPCLTCNSCLSMQKLAHPDFIEIDAASHTGVDNVRQIIDAASFVPVMGKKKIYLIDEAHMLSKAAFNALLKILEEPPKSAMFFLATTDPHKILDTIKSRCFQLFFHPVAVDDLVKHLANICKQENIPFDNEGLKCIALQTEGSVRDALNLIERVRLAYDSIDKSTVFQTLGFIDDEKLINLFSLVINSDEKDLLKFCSAINLNQFDPIIIFKRLIELIRYSLWIKSGINIESSEFIKISLEPLMIACEFSVLVDMLDLCYSYENIFAKTSRPSDLLEVVLIKLSMQTKIKEIKKAESSNLPNKPEITKQQVHKIDIQDTKWQSFLSEIEKLNDQLIISIFRQANIVGLDASKNKFEIIFKSELSFYNDILKSNIVLWDPIFKKYYNNVELIAKFTVQDPVKEKKSINILVENNKSKTHISQEPKLQVSNNEQWVKANMIKKVFPGVISVNEKNDEGIQ